MYVHDIEKNICIKSNHVLPCACVQDRAPLVAGYKDFPADSIVSFQQVADMQAELRRNCKKEHIQFSFYNCLRIPLPSVSTI